jgi:hypothetical protein
MLAAWIKERGSRKGVGLLLLFSVLVVPARAQTPKRITLKISEISPEMGLVNGYYGNKRPPDRIKDCSQEWRPWKGVSSTYTCTDGVTIKASNSEVSLELKCEMHWQYTLDDQTFTFYQDGDAANVNGVRPPSFKPHVCGNGGVNGLHVGTVATFTVQSDGSLCLDSWTGYDGNVWVPIVEDFVFNPFVVVSEDVVRGKSPTK